MPSTPATAGDAEPRTNGDLRTLKTHPLRESLHNEIHARPSERLEAPPDGKPAPGPFSVKLRVSREQAMDSPFFRKAYGFPDDPLGDEGETWRRIDDEWLTSGLGQLALQIDSPRQPCIQG